MNAATVRNWGLSLSACMVALTFTAITSPLSAGPDTLDIDPGPGPFCPALGLYYPTSGTQPSPTATQSTATLCPTGYDFIDLGSDVVSGYGAADSGDSLYSSAQELANYRANSQCEADAGSLYNAKRTACYDRKGSGASYVLFAPTRNKTVISQYAPPV